MTNSRFYILIDKPAVALQRTAIYYVEGRTIRRWNFETGENILWSAFPLDSDIQKIEISNSYIHVHYLSTVTASSNGYTGTSLVLTSYRRRLDLSAGWEQYQVWGWNNWYGPGYDDIYETDCLTFADGRTFYTAHFRWHEDPTVDHWFRNFITENEAVNYYPFDPGKPLYYMSASRASIGTSLKPNSGEYQTAELDSAWGKAIHDHDWTINALGSARWLYHQETGGGLTASKAVLVAGDGGISHITYEDHALSGYALGALPPVPFGDRSLLVLGSNAASGANSVWWDGSAWTDEFLGSSVGSLTTIRFRPGLAFCRVGNLYSLEDGSLLHSLGTVQAPTGWQVYPKRR